MFSVISPCGCDYMSMCICVLHVDQCVPLQCNSTAPISVKWAICRMLPNDKAVKCFFSAIWPLRFRDKHTPYYIMIPYINLFMVSAAGAKL